MKRAVILLAWWFLSFSDHRAGLATTGPFRNETDCLQARAWVGRWMNTSWCWWDGKP